MESYVNFQLYNDGDCHIKVNNGHIFLFAPYKELPIDYANSVKNRGKKNGKTFNWIGVKA